MNCKTWLFLSSIIMLCTTAIAVQERDDTRSKELYSNSTSENYHLSAYVNDDYDAMLEFMRDTLITYGNDLAMDCLGEDDVQKLVENEIKNLRKETKVIFIMSVVAFVVTFLLLIVTVIFNWRKSFLCITCPMQQCGKSHSSVQRELSHISSSNCANTTNCNSFDNNSSNHYKTYSDHST
uniref:Uncharacterized protein n=1 Tax=Ciona savignyi TaxID=51511 RepID=H2ZR53_CIOSA